MSVSGSNASGVEKRESEQPATPPPPPNGGVIAWLQVAGAFFLFFNSCAGLPAVLTGLIVGPLFDKGYSKTLIAVGTFLVVFGLMMTSLSSEYYQVFLVHGVAVGIGCACLFLPSIAIVATYFTTRRALATGITASGGSIGSVIFPIMFHKLICKVGFGWTTRILAFVALGGLLFSWAVMKTRLPPPKQARSLLDLSAFREPPFGIFSLGLFFSFVGLYFPFFYLPTYFSSFLRTEGNMTFYIVPVLNAASVFGRITPGLLADRLGSLNTLLPISSVASVMVFAWMGIRNVAGTIVFACIYGYASGAIVSLPPTILAKLTPNMGVVGTRMGMSFTFAGTGLLIGNPIAGALLSHDGTVFWKAQLFCAIMVTAGLLCFIGLRLIKTTEIDGWRI